MLQKNLQSVHLEDFLFSVRKEKFYFASSLKALFVAFQPCALMFQLFDEFLLVRTLTFALLTFLFAFIPILLQF